MSEARRTELLGEIKQHMKPEPIGFEQVTVTDAAAGLTAAIYNGASKAVITVETAPIRYRVDGGAPTATVGHIADIGDQIELESANEVESFKAIRTGATSAVISVTYSH